jgi:hypothetical protein
MLIYVKTFNVATAIFLLFYFFSQIDRKGMTYLNLCYVL